MEINYISIIILSMDFLVNWWWVNGFKMERYCLIVIVRIWYVVVMVIVLWKMMMKLFKWLIVVGGMIVCIIIIIMNKGILMNLVIKL